MNSKKIEALLVGILGASLISGFVYLVYHILTMDIGRFP